MDPYDPTSFNHRTERLSTGHTYHFVDQIPRDYDPATTPTLLCVHGFPDLWYGWRHVISPWVQDCGWRVVVPDMLGYGGTDKPAPVKHYSTKSLSADLAALLDLIGLRKAVVVGHDWGAAVSWRFALWHPERIQALVTLSIPFAKPRPEYLSLERIVELMPSFVYQQYFNDASSTKEIEENLPAFFKVFFGTDAGAFDHKSKSQPVHFDLTATVDCPGLLNTQEFNYYLENFRKGGMNGPLNYYRTTRLRFDEEAGANLFLSKSLPVLFIWGDADPICTPSQVERMHAQIPLLKYLRIEGKGHWLAVECKDVVARSVSKFVQDVCAAHVNKPRL